jgi:glycosyltransferase involved in cell wall biosynthesis
MRVLVISSVLPVDGIVKDNSIVIDIWRRLRSDFGYSPFFLRPISVMPRLLSRLKNEWLRNRRLLDAQNATSSGEPVHLFPIATKRKSALGPYFSRLHLLLGAGRGVEKYRNIGLVHANYVFPDGLIAHVLKKQWGIPFVLSVRRDAAIYLKSPVTRPLAISVLLNAETIICHNKESLDLINRYHGNNCVHMLPHPVDDFFFDRVPAEKSFAGRVPQSRGSNPVTALSVSRLLSLKHLDSVLTALSELRHNMDFRYLIAGDGPERQSLERLVDKLSLTSHVHFLGHQEKRIVSAIMQRCDLFVLPSYPETFGLVFAEALASGLPIIWARNSGIDGHVRDGEVGFSVDHRDPRQLREVLQRLIAEPQLRTRLSENAIRISKSFRWNEVLQRYVDIFQEIAPG